MSRGRLAAYLAYHKASADVGDIDPSYTMLRYLADRYEWTHEERYWAAWLYAMTYCGASVFYIKQEFPDAENVDVGRLERWWTAHGRAAVITQTDRRYVKANNLLVPAFESYRAWLGGRTQADHFASLAKARTPQGRYDAVYQSARKLYSFGRFTLFLYLEALHTITPLDVVPTVLDLDDATSCRNGLCYAYGYDHLVTPAEVRTPLEAREVVAQAWADLQQVLARELPGENIWRTETVLCAFNKYWRDGSRYIGYYLDRQAVEIAQLQARVRDGVCWEVLWQYRAECYRPEVLAERCIPAADLPSAHARRALHRLGHQRTRTAFGVTDLVLQ